MIQGDLNSLHSGSTPLAITLRRDDRIKLYARLLPQGTTTNQVLVLGHVRSIAIDHMFIGTGR